MKRGRAVAAVVFLLGGSTIAAAGPPADLFAECEARFAKDPQGEFSCGCFYSIATREPGQEDAVLGRLAAHLEGDPKNGCLLFTLGRIERLLHRPEAEGRLTAAAAAYAERALAGGETYARLNLTDLLVARGETPEAERQLDLAAAAATAGSAGPSGRPYLQAEVEVRRARLWLARGDPLEKVEALLRLAKSHVFPGGHDSLKRDTLEALGDVVHRLGRFDEAEAFFRRMIEVTLHTNWSGRSDVFGEAAARQNLAAVHLTRPPTPENREESRRLVEEALAAAERAGHYEVEAEARRLLGRLEGGPEGRRQIERSIEIASDLKDSFLLRQGLAALAAETVATDPAAARAYLARLAAVAPAVGEPDLELYGWPARFAVAWATLERPAAIAQVQEELRAIEALRAAPADSLTRAQVFSAWAEAYSWLAGRLLEAGDAARAFELLESRHARALLESSPAGPGPAPFATLEETRAALAEDEAFLYFQQSFERGVFGDFAGGSWLLVLTRGREPRIYRTPDPLELDPLVPAFVGRLAGAGEAGAGAARLEALVLGPALRELPPGVRRLILLPDQDLQLLPFAALRATPSGPSLAERYELAVAPSATLWLRWQARQTVAPRAVLALADPAASEGEEGFAPLPGARREARAAVAELGGASALRLGREASEAALASTDLGPFGILHFAVHAVHGRAGLRSERSALLLFPGAPGADGRLEPREIRRLPLSGKAVVLAACRGADGEVLAGEGALSLAHPFLGAGAEVVIASLWNLEDAAAARFGRRLYRQLGGGSSAGAAFAAAQRESIEAGEPPAFWAGLVLLGNAGWRLAPARPEPPSRWPWLAAPAAVLLITLVARRRRRARQLVT